MAVGKIIEQIDTPYGVLGAKYGVQGTRLFLIFLNRKLCGSACICLHISVADTSSAHTADFFRCPIFLVLFELN